LKGHRSKRPRSSLAGPTLGVCKRSTGEHLKCEYFKLFYSADGGSVWTPLSTRRTLWSGISNAFGTWPAIPVAYGWLGGRIAMAHVDFHEDESPRWRYLSTYDLDAARWSTRGLGPVESAPSAWWEALGFEVCEVTKAAVL
jgi:hypothetical protein